MKSVIKKISQFIFSRIFYLVLGILIAAAVSTVYAAVIFPHPTLPQPNLPLTTTRWNDLVDSLNNLDSRVGGIETDCGNGGIYQVWTGGGCKAVNPTTGGCSCPAGYTNYLTGQAYFNSRWDTTIYICLNCS